MAAGVAVPVRPLPGRDYPPAPDLSDAACRDINPDVMFPDVGDRGGGRVAARLYAAALSVCARCPVTGLCRSYAVAWPGELAGVWGGMTPSQIENAQRARRQHSTVT